MMVFRLLALAVALGASGAAWADTDCTDPVADWKPREMLRQEIERQGWTVRRIKVDDGCYEVRGTDRLGNRIKVKYAPASLRMRSLEVDFGSAGDPSDYLRAAPTAKGNARTEPAIKGKAP